VLKATGTAHSSSWPQDFERAALRAQAKASDEMRGQHALPKEAMRDAPMERQQTVDTPQSKRSKSWADIQSGDEDEKEDDADALGDPAADTDDSWTAQRIDVAARRGFELRRRGDTWDLKISMGSLEPALTQVGMERYCRWLRMRLTSFREEHGNEKLWNCRGEVDFSHNHLTNQMVWMLLETLAQHEVHTALLKLYANNISQGGVLAICEFIRMNEKPEALQELHLSHNEIDDDSALELLRTLKSQRPKYPPRRPAEGTGEPVLAPVWLRLNHNRIRDPHDVLKRAEDEAITICTAWDRQVCGTSKCVRKECPLVHLYSFQVQDTPKHERHEEHGENGRRRDRDRRYGHRDRERGDRQRNRDRKKDHDSEATGGWSGEASGGGGTNNHGKDPLWDGPDDHRSHANRRDAWDG